MDWGFLHRILIKFNFGPDFLAWIKLFYQDIESAVVINSWTSSFFRPSRGVRQGCPLSLLLYVISIEVLAVAIRTSSRFVGVPLPNSLEEYRCSGYVDDTTVAACTDASIVETFSIYGHYERASGACLNRGKSKGMWAGRLAPIHLTVSSGLKIFPFSVRPSTLAITAGQRGSQPSPSLSSAWPAGLVGRFPSKGRQLLSIPSR